MFDQGPPEHVVPFGSFSYSCQDDLVVKAEIDNIPYFNAPIYLENKEQIGKVDEIFGNIKDYSISVKLSENMKSGAFKAQQKLFIDPAKLLPLARFLPSAPGAKRGGAGGRGGRGGRGGAGGFGGEWEIRVYCCRLPDNYLTDVHSYLVQVVEEAVALADEVVVDVEAVVDSEDEEAVDAEVVDSAAEEVVADSEVSQRGERGYNVVIRTYLFVLLLYLFFSTRTWRRRWLRRTRRRSWTILKLIL